MWVVVKVMSDSGFWRSFGQLRRRQAVESHLVKVGILALILLVDVDCVQIDPAKLLNVTSWKGT